MAEYSCILCAVLGLLIQLLSVSLVKASLVTLRLKFQLQYLFLFVGILNKIAVNL